MDGRHGEEAWVTDGTPLGTQMLRDIRRGAAGSSPVGPKNFYVAADRSIYFAANDGSSRDGLWRSDSAASRVELLTDSETRRFLGEVGGKLLFTAQDLIHGEELWATDGTRAGTMLIKEIAAGSRGAFQFSRGAVAHGGILYFGANDQATAGLELWRSDGTTAGTYLVKDIKPNGWSGPSRFAVAGGRVLFIADDGQHGDELWVTDGTAAGTRMVLDIRPGSADSFAYATQLTVSGNRVLFPADDGSSGIEPWRSDGTAAGTFRLADVSPGAASASPHGFVALQGNSYFGADNGTAGDELWRTDGTSAGTSLVKDIHTGPSSSSPRALTVFGSRLYFGADDGAHGGELWTSDGTSAGTTLLKDVAAGARSSGVNHFTVAGNRLFFVASDGQHGYELWPH